MDGHRSLTPPEPIITQWAQQHLAPSCGVLDVAAGSGRHALWFAKRGHQVTAVDRDVAALRARPHANIKIVQADLEAAPWPLSQQQFDAVIVVNYLWRPLLPALFASVARSGHLLYETFAVGNETFGRPRNPDFLLRDNELQAALPDNFEVIDYGHGEVGQPPRAVRQRILARRVS